MQKLEKSIKGVLASAIVAEVLMLIFGIILLVFPETSLDIMRWALAIFFMVIGAGLGLRELTRPAFSSSVAGLMMAVLTFLLGLVILTHPGVLNIVPIVLGIWIIVSGVFSLRLSASLRAETFGAFLISVLSAAISIIAGFILILNPTDSTVALTILMGVVTIIYAVLGLVDTLVFRSNLKTLSKYLKDAFKA